MRAPPAGRKEPPPSSSAVVEPPAEMKKGPWTAEEDAILIEYVRKHGEGNWNAVKKGSSLRRYGQSCQLRCAIHLPPSLKKGSFSTEEEAPIVLLHSQRAGPPPHPPEIRLPEKQGKPSFFSASYA